MQDCIFCKIAKGEAPSKKIYDDASVMAFLDINPAAIGHTIVIPKKHFANIYDISQTDLEKTINAVKVIADRIKGKLNANGVNILQNNGRHAGQIVDHLHFHVIPRYENDNIMIKFPRAQVSEEDMSAIQNKLKDEPKERFGSAQWV